MSDLMLPRHHKGWNEARKAQQMAGGPAPSSAIPGMPSDVTSEISGMSSVHRITSDDFVTRKEVKEQVEQLERYILARREIDPDYHLPMPSGWIMMVLILTVPEKSGGGVVIVDDHREAKALSSPQGILLDMGQLVYTDENRHPFGAEHSVGDRIMWTKYDATTFQLSNGQRLGFMTDTQPIALIDTGWWTHIEAQGA